MSTTALHDVERELVRVVDRLSSMPLTRAEHARADVRAAAERLLEHTRRLDPAIPGATLPDLAPQGLAAMIAVLGRDWLAVAGRASEDDVDTVLAELVALRRALP